MAAAFPEGAYARDASPRFPGPSRNFSENGRLKVSKTDIEKASGLPPFPYAAFLSTASHSGQSGRENYLVGSCDEEHAAREQDAGGPCGRGNGGGTYRDDALPAGPSSLHGHLPCEGPAALAHCPALDRREKGGCVGKTFCSCVHLMSPYPVFVSLVLRTLLTRQCAAMPTYPVFLAVPAGQTGPLVGSASAYSVPRKVPFRGSSPPLAKTEYPNG